MKSSTDAICTYQVDIDFALAGIDKLLRSQELTFGFVGVAPSLAVLYIFGGWFMETWWAGSRGEQRYGGKQGRVNSFYTLRYVGYSIAPCLDTNLVPRRIERLLNNAVPPPPAQSGAFSASTLTKWQIPLAPLTQGLLLIYLSHLRSYAERQLPKRSRLREGFLEDLDDLEDPALGREEKMRVVERMWRSWGGELGWGMVAGYGERS